jgi:drug/metabolite transporter (DMT)-like permease
MLNVKNSIRTDSTYRTAVLQAFLVTFLWSTSWVLIKFGLTDIPAVTFAGLRYGLAFLVLLPFSLRGSNIASLRSLSRQDWSSLLLLGLLFYAITQGAQFLGLAYLPAVTVNLLLNFTTILVALLGIGLLAERPGLIQWGGMVLALGGAFVYFYPFSLEGARLVGVAIVLVGVLANALSAVLGRSINRLGNLSPLLVTLVSMGFGSALLLAGGLAFQGLPVLSPSNWLIITWLAVVNTALAFTLWNQTLRSLPAVESSIINSSMLIQIPILAWIFLGETLGIKEISGLVLAGVGVLIVQVWRLRPAQ